MNPCSLEMLALAAADMSTVSTNPHLLEELREVLGCLLGDRLDISLEHEEVPRLQIHSTQGQVCGTTPSRHLNSLAGTLFDTNATAEHVCGGSYWRA